MHIDGGESWTTVLGNYSLPKVLPAQRSEFLFQLASLTLGVCDISARETLNPLSSVIHFYAAKPIEMLLLPLVAVMRHGVFAHPCAGCLLFPSWSSVCHWRRQFKRKLNGCSLTYTAYLPQSKLQEHLHLQISCLCGNAGDRGSTCL